MYRGALIVRTPGTNRVNLLIESGKFPDQWCEGLITPIFKSGDKTIKLYIQRDLCDKLSEQVPLYCSK
jgi:hypothetical protein